MKVLNFELWPEAFNSFGAARDSGDADPLTEQRRDSRFKLSMPAEIRSSRGVVDFVYTRDVSQAGLSFQTAQWFLLGEEIDVTLHFADRLDAAAIRGKIIWTIEHAGERSYGVSCVN